MEPEGFTPVLTRLHFSPGLRLSPQTPIVERVRIEVRNPRHWRMLALSALFFTLSSIIVRFRRKLTSSHLVVLYGATFRPTLDHIFREAAATQESPLQFVYTSFDEAYLKKLEAHPPEGAISARPDTFRGALTLASAKVAILADRPRTMTILRKLAGLFFIDVWHGVSFKGIKRPGFLRHYDEVWVASDFLKDLYVTHCKIPAERVVAIGYSPFDDISKPPPSRERLLEALDLPRESGPIIGVAATWNEKKPSDAVPGISNLGPESLGKLSAFALENHCSFVFRNHLISGAQNTTYPSLYFRPQSNHPSPTEFLRISDILITDWSSLAFDFLHTHRPLLFLDSPVSYPRRFLIGPEHRPGPKIRHVDGLLNHLGELLHSPSILETEFGKQSTELLNRVSPPEIRGKVGKVQVERLSRICATVSP